MSTNLSQKSRPFLLAAFAPLALSFLADYVSKSWGRTLSVQWIAVDGVLQFIRLRNYGIASGLYTEVSPLLREVSLSTFAGFLVFIYLMVQYLLPTRNLKFRAGLSFIMGGILGNVTDRMNYGYVTDFIQIFPAQVRAVFNLADAFQWVGYLLILYTLIREWPTLWRASELRENYWINPKLQFSYCLVLMSGGLGFALVAGVFTYSYFKIAISEVSHLQPDVVSKILLSYFMVFGIVTAAFATLLFILGMIFSHRIAGPVYAFQRFILDRMHHKPTELNLRAKDHFQEFAEIASKLSQVDNLGRDPGPKD